MTLDDFKLVQDIVAKAAKLSARHNFLVHEIPRGLTPANEAQILLLLAEADRVVKQILRCLDEMEMLFEKASRVSNP